jgi:hypothetical protein
MRVQAALKAHSNLLGPTSAEGPLLGYKRVQGGPERAQSVRRPRKKRAMFSIRVAKYRLHRSHFH